MSETKTEERVTICTECEHCMDAPLNSPRYLCRVVPVQTGRNYVTGASYRLERIYNVSAHCDVRNRDGKCDDFKAK